jgi:uncharacterized membrane protein
VLAAAAVRGWHPAGLGAFSGLAVLGIIVLILGQLLDRIPIHLLQLAIGVLLLLFGMRWLRKAILRAAGVIALHDEIAAFAAETEELREQARRHEGRLDWLAGLASFKAVLLEGLEVVFIIIAVGVGMMLSAFAVFWTREGFGVGWPGADFVRCERSEPRRMRRPHGSRRPPSRRSAGSSP